MKTKSSFISLLGSEEQIPSEFTGDRGPKVWIPAKKIYPVPRGIRKYNFSVDQTTAFMQKFRKRSQKEPQPEHNTASLPRKEYLPYHPVL